MFSRSIFFLVKQGVNGGRSLCTPPNVKSIPFSASTMSSAASRRLWDVVAKYEDFIGITEVREAQARVISAESEFLSSQARRQEKQREIDSVTSSIREVHADLDKVTRSDDRYLELLTKEHGLIKEQKALSIDFKLLERVERDNFSILSQCLRDSHEKERSRAERTKYWSLIGSAVGALLGILGTTINNQLRMRELKSLVKESTDPGRVQSTLAALTSVIQTQQNQVRAFLNELKGVIQNGEPGSLQLLSLNAVGSHPPEGNDVSASADQLLEQFDSLTSNLKVQEESMKKEMESLKSMVAADHASKSHTQIVYVGPQLEDLLDRTEHNLEWKMKVNTLVAVVAGYGVLVLVIPLLASVLGGGGSG